MLDPARRSGRDQDRCLLTDADLTRVQVGHRDSGTGFGASARAASAANSCGPSPSRTSGSRLANCGSRVTDADEPAALLGHPVGEEGGRLLVGAVLQQPGEEQVARLEQREVLLVVDLAARQQPGGLEVEQRGGDDEELGGLAQVPVGPAGPDVRR